jgi:hypothetical protein
MCQRRGGSCSESGFTGQLGSRFDSMAGRGRWRRRMQEQEQEQEQETECRTGERIRKGIRRRDKLQRAQGAHNNKDKAGPGSREHRQDPFAAALSWSRTCCNCCYYGCGHLCGYDTGVELWEGTKEYLNMTY